MIRPAKSLPTVYLYRHPVDMRKGANGLSVIVQEDMQRHPGSGELFVFCNRSRNTIKILTWEVNGFVIWSKRLEKQRFQWPKHLPGDTMALSGKQLNWLLDGVNLNALEKHRPIEFLSVA